MNNNNNNNNNNKNNNNNNNNNSPKGQYVKLYFRLKQEEGIIERSVEAFMMNSKYLDSEIWNSLKRQIDKFEGERRKLTDSLRQTVLGAHQELKSIKVIDKTNIGSIDLESLKMKLQSLWKRIQEFKSTCDRTLGDLAGQQCGFDQDLNCFERSLAGPHKYLHADDNCHKKDLHAKAQTDKKEWTKELDYNKVEDLCSLLAKTGHSGNWSEKDHLLFLKLRRRHRSVASLVLAMRSKCPDLSNECIINHEAWYKTYLELRDKQRAELEEWRRRKERDRLDRRAARRDEEQPPPARPGGVRDRPGPSPEEKRAAAEKKKELVRQWKEQKEKTRAAGEERARDRRAATRRDDDVAESRGAGQTIVKHKQTVAVPKDDKNHIGMDEQPAKANRPTSCPPYMSSFILRMYRLKDQQFLEKRMNKILMKRSKNARGYAQPNRCRLFLYQTKSTLLKETKSWQERRKCIEGEKKKIGNRRCVKDLPDRTRVSWNRYDRPNLDT